MEGEGIRGFGNDIDNLLGNKGVYGIICRLRNNN